MSFLTGDIETAAIATERRLWRTLYPVAWRDSQHRIWASPWDFRFDKISSPRFVWPLIPPSQGAGDRAACIHDLLCRCRELMGLQQGWIDVEFRRQCRADGIGNTLATVKSGVVYVSGWLRPAAGDGIHRRPRYNGPVTWRDRRYPCLADWVREHYSSDGDGLHLWAAQEMGWA